MVAAGQMLSVDAEHGKISAHQFRAIRSLPVEGAITYALTQPSQNAWLAMPSSCRSEIRNWF